MQVLIALTAALVPLIITPGLLFHFDNTPKVVLLIGCVATLLLRLWVVPPDTPALIGTRQGKWFVILLALQLACFCIATWLSADPFLSLDGSEWRRLGLHCFTAIALFTVFAAEWLRSGSHMTMLLRSLAVATLLISIYTVAQYFGLDPLLPAEAYHAGEGPYTIVRPPGTLGHADYLASFLVFSVFTSVALRRESPTGWSRHLAFSATILSGIAIVLTGTRGGLAGLAAGLLALWILGGARIRRGPVLAGLACALCADLFVISPLGARLRARVHWSSEDPLGGARLLLWRDSIQMLSTKPLAGFGPETFIREFPRFQSAQLSRAYPDFFHESPHNLLLDVAVSQGVFAALLLIAFWCTGFFAGLRSNTAGNPVAAPLLAGSTGLMLALQFIVFVPATALCFFLLQSMLIALLPSSESTQIAQHTWSKRKLWTLRAAATAVAMILLIHGGRLLFSDAALQTVREQISNGHLASAAQAHQTVRQYEPRGGNAELYYSRAMAAVAPTAASPADRELAWKESLESATRAVATSEQRANAWYSLATLFAARGDSTGVERALRTSIAWAPNWFKPHWTLAQLLWIEHRNQEAMSEAVAAVDRNGGKNPEVLATWLTFANQMRQ